MRADQLLNARRRGGDLSLSDHGAVRTLDHKAARLAVDIQSDVVRH
jgi:hypothetical protein